MMKTFATPSVDRPDKLTRELVRNAKPWGPLGPVASASGLLQCPWRFVCTLKCEEHCCKLPQLELGPEMGPSNFLLVTC